MFFSVAGRLANRGAISSTDGGSGNPGEWYSKTCVVFFGGVSGCVSNPGDWYSKCASGDVRFSGCVEDSGRSSSDSDNTNFNNAVFLVSANYLCGPRSVLIGPAEGTVRSCCRQ